MESSLSVRSLLFLDGVLLDDVSAVAGGPEHVVIGASVSWTANANMRII